MTKKLPDGSYELTDPDQLREAIQRLGQAEDALESLSEPVPCHGGQAGSGAQPGTRHPFGDLQPDAGRKTDAQRNAGTVKGQFHFSGGLQNPAASVTILDRE